MNGTKGRIGDDLENTPFDKPCLFDLERAEQWFSNLLHHQTLPRLWKGGDLHGRTTDDQSSFQPFGQSDGTKTGAREATRLALNSQSLSNPEFDDDVTLLSADYVIINSLPSTMSALVQGYSSDEEDTSSTLHDAFNLAAIPSAQTHRFEPTTSTTVPQAAPDVLAQVRLLHSYHRIL